MEGIRLNPGSSHSRGGLIFLEVTAVGLTDAVLTGIMWPEILYCRIYMK